MIISLFALLFFGVLVYHSNRTNKSTSKWTKHCIALMMLVCGGVISYAFTHTISFWWQLIGSAIFVAVASASWAYDGSDGGS